MKATRSIAPLLCSLLFAACLAPVPALAFDDQYHDDIDKCSSSDMDCFGRAAKAYDERLAADKAAAEAKREAAQRAEVEYRESVASFDKQTESLRQRAAAEYLHLVRSLYPGFNGIAPIVVKQGDSFSLYCAHPFFSQVSFAAGPQGPRIRRWVLEHAGDLHAARISAVGVTSQNGSHVAYQVPRAGAKKPKAKSPAAQI